MKRWLLPCLVVLAIAGCGPDHIAEFWRPISEPNLLMSFDRAQKKLDFDLSQCKCGIFPTNVSHNESYQFQPDKQRMVATGVDVTADDDGNCMQRPSPGRFRMHAQPRLGSHQLLRPYAGARWRLALRRL